MKSFVMKLMEYEDEYLIGAICSIIAGLYITNLFDGLSDTVGISAGTVSLACKLAIFVCLLFCVKTILYRLNKLLIAFCAVLVVVPVLQYFLFPNTWNFFFETYKTFVLSVFPGVICFAVLRDYAKCRCALTWVSVGIAVANLMVLLIWGGDAFSKYNMGYANSLILPTNLLIWNVVLPAKKWYYRVGCASAALVNILSVFAYGSRGALACVAVFCVFLFFKTPIPFKYGRFVKLGIVVALVPVLIFYKTILTFVNTIFTSLGFYSRTLELLVSNLTYDSNRSQLWERVWTDFAENPFAIRGINSDYGVIKIYSHNAVLELLHAFGVIVAAVIVLIALYGIYKTVRVKTDAYGILRILTLASFFPLCMWSNSIWSNMYVWLWVVVCLRRNFASQTDLGEQCIRKVKLWFKQRQTKQDQK